ncbi:uncharacterized protein SPPG_04357 [Spizellomyces punctatus DAOM BR117]|uniref:Uncharacterized protein n=1 Tax=Spizellomyces punctatus (strain DAOM BR117) TaxID=645134 RepID=A0A0L0HGG9_SPIPD|nr:uncharacterized protein SPPG_04357 [Spizellomyces punctatus DAOM BR117]KND00010.1 hypothetical protein SPPG_04357 [Spizellomyces punctatus DAOM BR117]|eukprot:XP_016608049.1 hypothetical protein SPPG_04357 [Spizellomyces punctatus DAOM BR117]
MLTFLTRPRNGPASHSVSASSTSISSMPFHPRTSSLPSSSHSLVPLWDPVSKEQRLVLRDRICAVTERDGNVVLAVDDMDGGLLVVVGTNAITEDQLGDEGFEDPHGIQNEGKEFYAERDWSLNPGQRALTLPPGMDLDEFVQNWCEGFLVLEETDSEENSGWSIATSQTAPYPHPPRVAVNPSRILDVHPDIQTPLPGYVVLDFGQQAPWLRTRCGTRRARTEEKDARVKLRVKGVSLADFMVKVDPLGWEEVSLS